MKDLCDLFSEWDFVKVLIEMEIAKVEIVDHERFATLRNVIFALEHNEPY